MLGRRVGFAQTSFVFVGFGGRGGVGGWGDDPCPLACYVIDSCLIPAVSDASTSGWGGGWGVITF